MALALDTLVQAKRLQEAGFNEKQAEALAAALRDVAAPYDISALPTKADLAAFATKADLAAFPTKADLKADLASFATKADLATLKADIIQWIVGSVAGAIVLNVFMVIGGMFGMAKLLGH